MNIYVVCVLSCGLSFSSLPVCVRRGAACVKSHGKLLNSVWLITWEIETQFFLLSRLRPNEAVFTADDLFWSHRIFVPRALLYPLRISSERRAKNEQREVTFFEVPESSKMESSFEGFDWFTLCNSSLPSTWRLALSLIPQTVSIASLSPSIYIFTSHEQEEIKWK